MAELVVGVLTMAHPFANTARRALLLISVVSLLGCADSSPTDTEDTAGPPETPTVELRREPELTSNCHNWPAQEFSATNYVERTRTSVIEGDHAIDFTLKDTDGVEYRLSQLLRTRPVLIVFGAFT
jgi:cytochrome oxidase Cu insertion factor (SCO1/SenC/PrrC family)